MATREREDRSLSRTEEMFFTSVRARRDELGLTQQQVADRMEVSRYRYSEIERGRFSPTLSLMVRISDALKIKLHKLLGSGLS